MMKKEPRKKFIWKVLILILMLFVFVTPQKAQAASKASKAKKAYLTYYNKHLSDESKYPNVYITYQDINRDGIPEMIFSSFVNRATIKIFTYKKNKVICMKTLYGGTGVYYKKSKKQIAIFQSDGAYYNYCTIYKMKNSKLKKVVSYSMEDDVYYRNKTRISRYEYLQYTSTIENKWKNITY